MTKVNIAQFKAKLPEYLKLLQRGESISLTNHGEEVVLLGSIQNIYNKKPDLKNLLESIENRPAAKRGLTGTEVIRQLRDEE